MPLMRGQGYMDTLRVDTLRVDVLLSGAGKGSTGKRIDGSV